MNSRRFTWVVLALLVVSRWALMPPRLHSFDSVNFALALEDFDPGRHQPQPPGYILFVGLARLMHLFFARPEWALTAAGLAGACAAAVLLRRVAGSMFGERAGLLAMAVFAFDPVLWFGGLTNPVRVFLAAASAAVAWTAWLAMERPEARGRIYAAFATLGVAAGFRPETSLVLFPLLLYAWWQTGAGAQRLVRCAAAVLAAAAPWLAVTSIETKQPGGVSLIFRAYVEAQFQGTSALFGARPAAAMDMALMALVWTFLGSLAWIWALPFAVRDRALWKGRAGFLAAWFLPPFLFSSLIHIGDPDHALASIAALAAIGGAVLSRFRAPVPAIAAAVAAVHAAIFFFPTGALHRASSYTPIADIGRSNEKLIGEIERLRGGKAATIVSWGGPVTFRHLSYYFPDDYVAVFPGVPEQPEPGQPMLEFYRHGTLPGVGEAGLLNPAGSRLICIASPGFVPGDPSEWRGSDTVHYRDGVGAAEVRIGSHRLLPAKR